VTRDDEERDEESAPLAPRDPNELGETAGKGLGGIDTGPQQTPGAQDPEREG
jgi:hypothetical protein